MHQPAPTAVAGEILIQNDEFASKMMNFVIKDDEFCIFNPSRTDNTARYGSILGRDDDLNQAPACVTDYSEPQGQSYVPFICVVSFGPL